MTPQPFSNAILRWYDEHGRKNLPWQQTGSPYHVWLSEIMLQQTQVNTVIPYFQRFIERFPSLETLSTANQDEVLHLWTGLGYYNRARNLHKTARLLIEKYNAHFPRDLETLQSLPGIGRSTAGAIMATALEQRAPILDGNVKRVLTRFYAIEGWPSESAIEKNLWEIAETNTPQSRYAEYTQAIMDIGALICTRTKPNCSACPLCKDCLAHQQGLETNYPTPKLRKASPICELTMLILVNPRNEILLEKRPPTGIWANLWTFPECPDPTNIKQWCEQRYRCKLKSIENLPPFRHILSHRILNIHPIQAQASHVTLRTAEPNQQLWYNTTHPQSIGLSAPVVRLLSQLTSENFNHSQDK